MSAIGNDWKVPFFGISLLLINFIQAFPITTVGPSAFVSKSEVDRKVVVLHDAVTEPSAIDPNEPRLILSPYIPESLVPLFEQAALTTIPKPFDATKDGTEKYNYEWGSWVNEETLSKLRSCIDEVQLVSSLSSFWYTRVRINEKSILILCVCCFIIHLDTPRLSDASRRR